ncbi:unnamed protein product, partial [Onchocerca flexuosa]|uniref:LIM zinc-binding domain-containing protein n=1 Tax=Onchocerca flexuosa TaxID=387005 RepID=A0A183GXW3_9BILA
ETVNNDGFIANNRLWHHDHFHCSRCRANITHEYYIDDGNVVCVTCTLIRPTPCHECGHVINETYLKAVGYCWHQKCFLCYGCKKPFPSSFSETTENFWHLKFFLYLNVNSKICLLMNCYRKIIEGAKYWLLNGHPYDSDCYWGARLDAQYFAK